MTGQPPSSRRRTHTGLLAGRRMIYCTRVIHSKATAKSIYILCGVWVGRKHIQGERERQWGGQERGMRARQREEARRKVTENEEKCSSWVLLVKSLPHPWLGYVLYGDEWANVYGRRSRSVFLIRSRFVSRNDRSSPRIISHLYEIYFPYIKGFSLFAFFY